MNPYEGINILADINPSKRRIYTKHSFFVHGEQIITIVREDKLLFRRPSLDYSGTSNIVRAAGKHLGYIVVLADIPHGRFDFDEDESSEDQMVVYFK